jgi:hypothetical protein
MKRSLLTLIGVIVVVIGAASVATALTDLSEPTDGWTMVRSDEDIDPDQCNPIHNINACSEEELIQLGIYPRVQELAPIEDVAIRIAESFPPQYFVEIRYGLRNGCIQADDYEVTRDGNRIDIAVTVFAPAPEANIICTQLYGTDTRNVVLGTDFQPGETYTVNVNDQTTTFVAQ